MCEREGESVFVCLCVWESICENEQTVMVGFEVIVDFGGYSGLGPVGCQSRTLSLLVETVCLLIESGPPSTENDALYRGTSPIRNRRPPLGPPQDPRYSPTVGS